MTLTDAETIMQFRGQYAFLSNFYPVPVQFGTQNYPTLEHAFQAAKCPDDEAHVSAILAAPTPGNAKYIGRRCKLRPDWEESKDRVMLGLLRLKFYKPYLKACIISTGGAVLIDGNYWHDNYWGHCECLRCSRLTHANKLGLLLMQVRSELRRGY
jgi:ribA/ribD-fused uncharacterized protein